MLHLRAMINRILSNHVWLIGVTSQHHFWLFRSLCSEQGAFCQTSFCGVLPEIAGFVDTARAGS